jgi:hypothetical protein
MATSNGESKEARGPLELSDTLTIATSEGGLLPFEVVGIVEDPESGASYAVLHHEAQESDEDEFIVTDPIGNLLEDERLAQGILDEFLAFADEDEDGAHDGETL